MKRFLAATAAAGMMIGAAHAGPTTPAQVEQVLTANGVTDIQSASADGTYSQLSGNFDLGYDQPIQIDIRVMNCTNNASCTTVIMFANFPMDGAPTLNSYEAVNEYNDSYPYGRAYVYIYDPTSYSFGVDMTTDLKDENTFGTNEVDNFGMVVQTFMDHMLNSEL